jgi:diacylglycerol kinase
MLLKIFKSLQIASAVETVIKCPTWIYTLFVEEGKDVAATQVLTPVLTCQVVKVFQLPEAIVL